MDKLEKVLDYAREQENKFYEYAYEAFENENMQGNMVNLLQATAFQRVRYFIEDMLEEGEVS